MKFLALKELPKGTQPGQLFDATKEEGDVLILVGAARKATPADLKAAAEGDADPPRRQYQRRDLTAEG